jgi:hypothetical protein
MVSIQFELVNHSHSSGNRHKKSRLPAAVFSVLLFRLSVLALLVGDAAAGLAGRLAGSLALAAAAVCGAVAKITGFQGNDMFEFHDVSSIVYMSFYTIISVPSQGLFCGHEIPAY